MASVDEIRALLAEQTVGVRALLEEQTVGVRALLEEQTVGVRALLEEQTATLKASQNAFEARIHTRLDMLEDRIDARFDALNERIAVLDVKLERIDGSLLKLLARVDHHILLARYGDGRFPFDDANSVLFVLEHLHNGNALPLTAELAKLIYSVYVGQRNLQLTLVHGILQACSRKLDESGIDTKRIRFTPENLYTLFEQTFELLETTTAINDSERHVLSALLRRCPYSASREANIRRDEATKGSVAKRKAETSIKTNPKRQDMEEDEETGLVAH
jgi:hypothetical protein